MAFGLDYSMGMPSITTMQQAGVQFVCRYIGYTSPSLPQTKILLPSEVAQLEKGGIHIVSNYEWYNERARTGTVDNITGLPSGSGTTAGKWDAKVAANLHNNLGGPTDRPIYFSVDEDTDGPSVSAYFHDVASVIGLARTGAYGSYRVIKYLLDNNLIRWAWQTYAWSGNPTQWDSRANIRQYNNSVVFGGTTVDFDSSITPDYGQWGVNTMTPTADMLASAQDRWDAYFKQLRLVMRQFFPTMTVTEIEAAIPLARVGTGIHAHWLDLYFKSGIQLGSASSYEYPSFDWEKKPLVCQDFGSYRIEYYPGVGIGGVYGPTGKVPLP